MDKFISGNEAAVAGALAAGAKAMYGYPITPSTEILQGWSEESDKNDGLIFLQTEDETAAGFAVNGSVLMGVKTFTATAGPGTVLMQDGLSMAENLRLPTVTIIMQRGGPSTGTVNYSQQELTLACFGGNGEGLRIVYSAGSPQEMYDYTIKAFDSAWRFRFPTLLLGDGYIGKQKTLVNLHQPLLPIKSENLLKDKNLRNCFSNETEFSKYLGDNISEYDKIIHSAAAFQRHGSLSAKKLVLAHGSVYYSVKEALAEIDKSGKEFQVFRPITLRPLASNKLQSIVNSVKSIFLFESSLGQFNRLIKDQLRIEPGIKYISNYRPAQSFSKEDIVKVLKG